MKGEFNLVIGALDIVAGDLLVAETDSDIDPLLQRMIALKQKSMGID